MFSNDMACMHGVGKDKLEPYKDKFSRCQELGATIYLMNVLYRENDTYMGTSVLASMGG